LAHAMSLINGTMISDALQASDNKLRKLAETEQDPRKLVEGVYLSILNRPPTDKELRGLEPTLNTNRVEAVQDLAWALMNSPAFLFNR